MNTQISRIEEVRTFIHNPENNIPDTFQEKFAKFTAQNDEKIEQALSRYPISKLTDANNRRKVLGLLKDANGRVRTKIKQAILPKYAPSIYLCGD